MVDSQTENPSGILQRKTTRRGFLNGAKAVGLGLMGLGLGRVSGAEPPDPVLQKQAIIPGLAVGESSLQHHEALKKPEGMESFPWSLNEVTMGEGAGFDHAKKGESITVWIDESVRSLFDNSAFEKWNNLARSMGRKNDLFTIITNSERAHVRMVTEENNDKTFVYPYDAHGNPYKNEHQKGPFSYARIVCEESGAMQINSHMLAHELSHVLGFSDGMSKEQWESFGGKDGYRNPYPGYIPEKPMNSITNYTSQFYSSSDLGPDDAKLLWLAGYITNPKIA